MPLTIYFANGRSTRKWFKVTGQRSRLEYVLPRRPVRVGLDEDYDVLRRLTVAEMPPMIATLMSRPRVTIIGTPAEHAKFGSLIDGLDKEAAVTADGRRAWRPRRPARSHA